MGIGFTIIGLCDFVYCTNDTKFSAPLVKLAQGIIKFK
jgi:enoyl-CoA hydratase/carnithine racemase